MRILLKQLCPPLLWSILKRLKIQFATSSQSSEENEIIFLLDKHLKINKELGNNVIALREGINLKLHPESRNAFEHFCYRSPAMVNEMDAFIELAKSKTQLLDIGALHGVFSLAFASASEAKSALAVDASPLAFSKLLYNIHVNPLAKVVPIECALSDHNGEVQMHFEWEHAVSAGSSSNNSFAVACITGDKLCEENKFAPDIIKIDVEGHEVKVLKGLQKTISKHKPLIFLELHPDRIRQEFDQLQDIITILKDAGYNCYDLDKNPYSIEKILTLSADERIICDCNPII